MKCLSVLMLFFAFGSSQAEEISRYDQALQECTQSSDLDLAACKRSAKQIVLSTNQAYDAYLSCIDYGHSGVSQELDEQCLREIK